MSRININYQDIDKLRKCRICGKGMEGISYFLDEKTILKLYKFLCLENDLHFVGLKSDFIAFPIDVYGYQDSKYIVGYTSKFCKGFKLESGFKESLLIEDLVKAYNMARTEIERYPNIFMDDLSKENMIYNEDDDSISFIDTSFWKEKASSLNTNLKVFDSEMLGSLVISTLDIARELLRSKSKLGSIYGRSYMSKDNLVFLEFLDEYIREFEKEHEKVKTIGDLVKKS